MSKIVTNSRRRQQRLTRIGAVALYFIVSAGLIGAVNAMTVGASGSGAAANEPSARRRARPSGASREAYHAWYDVASRPRLAAWTVPAERPARVRARPPAGARRADTKRRRARPQSARDEQHVAATAPAPAAVSVPVPVEQPVVEQPAPATAVAAPQRRVMRMEVTAYCACKKCCGPSAHGVTASGKPVSHDGGRFVAADTRVLPFGTKLSIPGYAAGRPVEVIDRGGAIKGNKLDVYFASHKEALKWGRQWLDVTVVE